MIDKLWECSKQEREVIIASPFDLNAFTGLQNKKIEMLEITLKQTISDEMKEQLKTWYAYDKANRALVGSLNDFSKSFLEKVESLSGVKIAQV